jgi:putative hydrolase of the HAD superfamily
MIKDDSKMKNKTISDSLTEKISDEIFKEFSGGSYWQKYDNCDLILAELKKSNFKLGVISNFDERLFDILKNLDIRQYFDFVCIPSTCNGSYKPDK